MQRVKFKISPDSIIISYFFIGMLISIILLGSRLYGLDLRVETLRILFISYHIGFWAFFGWYGFEYYRRN